MEVKATPSWAIPSDSYETKTLLYRSGRKKRNDPLKG
jgi:hypothetical protein